jgi:hypothetical protein
MALKAGIDRGVIAETLGHTSTKLVDDTYGWPTMIARRTDNSVRFCVPR